MITTVVSVLSAAALVGAANPPKLVNQFKLADAAFTSPAPDLKNGALLISAFNPFGADSINYVDDIAKVVGGATPEVTVFSSNTTWPNELYEVPASVFGQVGILVADGFLASPSKSTGSISLYTLDSPDPIVLSTPKSNWFFHRALWKDMNGDGKLDIVAARATKPLFANPGGELIWLEQPASDPLSSGPWKEHLLVTGEGPDVFFALHDFDGKGNEAIVATQYFSKQLVAYWCAAAHWGDCDESSVQSKVIDTKVGQAFDLQFVDLDGDNVVELLVSNNEEDKTGAVFAYEIPSAWQTADWTRHTLFTSPFSSIFPGQGSPGAVHAFYPNTKDTGKMTVVVSGDDSGHLYLLNPEADAWTYTPYTLCNSTGTIGAPTVADVNGDGSMELFVPYYAEGRVEIYSF